MSRPRFWNQTTICASIRGFVDRTGAPPSPQAVRQCGSYGLPSFGTIRLYFPSLDAAIRAAGYDPLPVAPQARNRAGFKARG